MSNDTLWKVYETTILRFADTTQLVVDLAYPLSELERTVLTRFGVGAQFAVITAYNPGGRNVSDARNHWRHLRMKISLAARRTSFIAACGQSPDGSHRERGFAVAMSRSDAAALALRFGQLAIYWFDGECFWLDGVLGKRASERLPV